MKSKKLRIIIIVVLAILLLALIIHLGMSVAEKIEKDKRNKIVEEVLNSTLDGCNHTIGYATTNLMNLFNTSEEPTIYKEEQKDIYDVSFRLGNRTEASKYYDRIAEKDCRDYGFDDAYDYLELIEPDKIMMLSIHIYYNAKTNKFVGGYTKAYCCEYLGSSNYRRCAIQGDDLESVKFWLNKFDNE